jgi:hypothetical protein
MINKRLKQDLHAGVTENIKNSAKVSRQEDSDKWTRNNPCPRSRRRWWARIRTEFHDAEICEDPDAETELVSLDIAMNCVELQCTQILNEMYRDRIQRLVWRAGRFQILKGVSSANNVLLKNFHLREVWLGSSSMGIPRLLYCPGLCRSYGIRNRASSNLI